MFIVSFVIMGGEGGQMRGDFSIGIFWLLFAKQSDNSIILFDSEFVKLDSVIEFRNLFGFISIDISASADI